MLIPEAKWFATQMKSLPDNELFPLLNLGSQTAEFRASEQPWLERYIFDPLRKRRGVIVHSDMQAAEGVDLVGDLTDPVFRQRLKEMGFRSMICSNLLEHVANREEFVHFITSILPVGGLLFVSVPNRFPYHPDPIDTMFRPTPEELAALFPGTEVVRQSLVRCGNYTTFLMSRFCWSPGRTIGKFLPRRKVPKQATTGPSAGSPVKRLLPWLIRGFRVSCVILRRT